MVRAFARYAVNWPFTVTFSAIGTAGAIRGRMENLGQGGLCGVLEEDMVAVGQRVWLEFQSATASEPLRLLSRVCHGFDGRYGFEFQEITPEQREGIHQACQGLPIV